MTAKIRLLEHPGFTGSCLCSLNLLLALFLVSTNSCCALCLALGGGYFYIYHCYITIALGNIIFQK